MKTVKVGKDDVPAIGQGTSHSTSQQAIARGIDLGMTLIDTAEVYGTEELVGKVCSVMHRKDIFLVSKVWPDNVTNMAVHCEESLRKLRTDYLDLYLLHWPGNVDLDRLVDRFESLQAAGKIRYWGVSNFS